MKAIKNTLSSGPVTIKGIRISAQVDRSALLHNSGFFISVVPSSLSIETGSGKYSYNISVKEKSD